jgi:hypothetical protein
MTVTLTDNDDKIADLRTSRGTRTIPNSADVDFDELGNKIHPAMQNKWRRRIHSRHRRALPSWSAIEIPRWGARFVVPEWDDDEIIVHATATAYDDDDDDDDDGEDDGGDIDGGGDGADDDYRRKNGWMVRSPASVFFFRLSFRCRSTRESIDRSIFSNDFMLSLLHAPFMLHTPISDKMKHDIPTTT